MCEDDKAGPIRIEELAKELAEYLEYMEGSGVLFLLQQISIVMWLK